MMEEYSSEDLVKIINEAYAGKMAERLAAWEEELLATRAIDQENDLKARLSHYTGIAEWNPMAWLDGLSLGEKILHESGVRDQLTQVEDDWWDTQFAQDDERWDVPADEFYAIEERSEWRDYSMSRGEYSEYNYSGDDDEYWARGLPE